MKTALILLVLAAVAAAHVAVYPVSTVYPQYQKPQTIYKVPQYYYPTYHPSYYPSYYPSKLVYPNYQTVPLVHGNYQGATYYPIYGK